ncbi:transcriptional regulatory protein SIN3 [Lycium ferocissimum]|uniref:transcriptional regulatory protein SIN3 n=1 Tax=Lycium ferocissimum TaxID=112874 RepID=UPI0028166C68|nr:transcriptional regulatory protein SIN3 [Lycium ferocissimum]
MVFAGVEAVAYSFIRRVKSHPQLYCQFRQVMSRYDTEKDVSAVISELENLFQSHHDLLTGYRVFLPPQFQETLPQSRQPRKNNVIHADTNKLNPCIGFMNKVQKRFADERGVIRAYLEIIREITKGKLSNKEAYDAVAKIFGDENQDLVDEFELLLGTDYGARKKIKKKEEEASPSNSGDEIKTRRQKKHDDFRMEDEMFEADIHLSHVRRTVNSAKALMQTLRESADQIINIDKYFSAVSLSCIRKEYKEQGFAIIKRLREDPKHVLPQILSQLEPREAELVESREKRNKYWREVHEQKRNFMTTSS